MTRRLALALVVAAAVVVEEARSGTWGTWRTVLTTEEAKALQVGAVVG
jgi:hypothetical protein